MSIVEADGLHTTSISLSEQGKKEKKRKRSAKWSEEESIILLESLRDLVQRREAGEQCAKGSAKWQHISQELNRRGCEPRVAKSVGERWDTLRQAYLHVEGHLRAGEDFAQALRESRKDFKFLPAEYTHKWHALAAGCGPTQKKKQKNSGAELARVENTVAKQKIIDASPCDVSLASVSFETIAQAFHKHIRSLESLLSRSRDSVSASQRCDETDEPGDVVGSLLSIVEAVKTHAKFEKSELYSLEIDKREWKSVHDHAFSLLQGHGCSSRRTPRDANSNLEQALEHFQGLVYPQNDPDPVTITKEDIRILNSRSFLNDKIIDFYIKYLLQTLRPRERLPTLYVFNSFFFCKLAGTDTTYKQGRAAFEGVKKWTMKIPIFEKDYIFIPVNQSLHWSLIIICHPGHMGDVDGPSGVSVGDPCILHLDSYEGHHTGLEDCIKNYLLEEWNERNPDADPRGYFDETHFISAKVPQQDNNYDCGIFLLHYVELFLKVAPTKFSLKSIRNNLEPNFLRRDWFKPSEASAKRPSIQQLIISLSEGTSPAFLKDAPEPSNFEVNGELAGTSLEYEHDTHKGGSDLVTRGSQFLGPRTRERTDSQEKEILPDMQPAVTMPEMLVGSGRESPPSETQHGEVGPMPQYVQITACTPSPHDTLLQIPCLLIEDPTKCHTTIIALPPHVLRGGGKLYYIHQGDSLVLQGNSLELGNGNIVKKSTFHMLKHWKRVTFGKGTPISRSPWQLLCDGVHLPGLYYYRDCKDGVHIVEATSTTIVIYDGFNPMAKLGLIKVWSPLGNIEDNDWDGEDKLLVVLLHPNNNIVFWATKYGVIGAYNFQNEKEIGRVSLRHSREYEDGGVDLIFSITLNMLVVCYKFNNENLFTWTLGVDQLESLINGTANYLFDLHNDQVQLLLGTKDSLAIYDLRQRKELHRWHTKDIKYLWIDLAKYSCDSQLVYAVFWGNSIGVFDANCLQLHCRITPCAFMRSNENPNIYRIVPHPQKRNQFAIISWARPVILIIEPSHELEGEWVCKANQGVGGQIQAPKAFFEC